MTSPTTSPEPAKGSSDKAPEQRLDQAVAPRRPAGEVGGHTVQESEQPVAAPGQVVSSRRPAGLSAIPAPVEADEPSEPTTALYLRPVAAPPVATKPVAGVVAPAAEPEAIKAAALAFNARADTLTAQSAALVDSITRGLAEALALSLRPVVASTIDALIPMILTLGNIPEPEIEGAEAADVATSTLSEVEGESGEAPG